MQGVTVCIASGDDGADSKMGDGYAHVQYPASDPWVLSVGGTTVRNIQGMAYEEYVWNDETGATGGGISDFFPMPPYQQYAGIPPSLNDGYTGRGVPDVAANASPVSGVSIIVNGRDKIGAGTSAYAPLWAGLTAVINNALPVDVGFINPILYKIAPEAFAELSGLPGPLYNGYNGTVGYPMQRGWDACTGWGSINGKSILRCLEPYFT